MEYGYDTFSTVLPGDIFELLLELGNEMGIDPFSSIDTLRTQSKEISK